MNLLQFSSAALFENGPIISAWICDKSLEKGKHEYAFHKITAIIDTGATHSGIDKSLVAKLNLQPANNRDNFTVGGISQHCTYSLTFLFDSDVNIPFSTEASDIDLSLLHCDGKKVDFIIGRDILRNCIFTYNGIKNSFKIEFDKNKN